MPRIAIAYSAVLILIGVFGYIGSGAASVTALIPAFLGLPALVCAILAARGIKVAMMMHLVAGIALLALLGTARSVPGAWDLVTGAEVTRAGATVAQFLTAVLSLVFLVLAIRSFIAARTARP
jgi:hypothetical protein